MINKNWVIIGLVTALLILLFFFTCNKPNNEIKYVPEVKKVETRIIIDSIANKKITDSFKVIEKKLLANVNENKNDLKAAQELVVELLNQAPEYIHSDTTELLSKIEQLKIANNAKDSLCNTTISYQDSIITIKESKYQSLQEFSSKQRRSINDLLVTNKSAETEINRLIKQVRKQKSTKVLYKILGGAAIIYGVTKSL